MFPITATLQTRCSDWLSNPNLAVLWTNFQQTKPYTDPDDRQIKNLEIIIRIQRRFEITVMTREFPDASTEALNANKHGRPGANSNSVDDQFVPNQTTRLCCQWCHC